MKWKNTCIYLISVFYSKFFEVFLQKFSRKGYKNDPEHESILSEDKLKRLIVFNLEKERTQKTKKYHRKYRAGV